jgi:hypothetical protein
VGEDGGNAGGSIAGDGVAPLGGIHPHIGQELGGFCLLRRAARTEFSGGTESGRYRFDCPLTASGYFFCGAFSAVFIGVATQDVAVKEGSCDVGWECCREQGGGERLSVRKISGWFDIRKSDGFVYRLNKCHSAPRRPNPRLS